MSNYKEGDPEHLPISEKGTKHPKEEERFFAHLQSATIKDYFSTKTSLTGAVLYGDLVDIMDRMTLEELKQFISEEPVWSEDVDQFYRCTVAARCRYFLVKKTGGLGFYNTEWWEKPEYIMPYMVYPLGGKYPELNHQYLMGGDLSFKGHNILFLPPELRRL